MNTALFENDFPISMEAFVALSPLFGYALVDRSAIRKRQDRALSERLSTFLSGQELQVEMGQDEFVYNSVDFLVHRDPLTQKHQFYVVEVNGSNAAGLTDVHPVYVEKIIDAFSRALDQVKVPLPYAIINTYTGDKNINVHERLLLIEGMRQRFPEYHFHYVTSKQLESLQGQEFAEKDILVVIGPIQEMLPHISYQQVDHTLTIAGHPVGMLINDLAVDRIHYRLPEWDVARSQTLVLNKIHPLYNLKAVTYKLLQEHIVPALSSRYPVSAFQYWQANTKEELIERCAYCIEQLKLKIVIKPYASSVGLGIQFLGPEQTTAEWKDAIEQSLAEVEQRYQGTSPIFPYTICEFVETALSNFPAYQLKNRKYDLRVFVVSDQKGEVHGLRAIPAVAKIASAEYDSHSFHREGLQTNTMRLTQRLEKPAHNSMSHIFETLIQPLNHPETLRAIELTETDIQQLGELATHIVTGLIAQYRQC